MAVEVYFCMAFQKVFTVSHPPSSSLLYPALSFPFPSSPPFLVPPLSLYSTRLYIPFLGRSSPPHWSLRNYLTSMAIPIGTDLWANLSPKIRCVAPEEQHLRMAPGLHAQCTHMYSSTHTQICAHTYIGKKSHRKAHCCLCLLKN